jgi:hypothetical protein
MSYYTALSRSSSAAGTIIIQGFDASKITRGCSGYLRQEFREHEILDDITRLKYEGQLPDQVEGSLRNTLIRCYQNWKGTSYVPEKTDTLLRWSVHDPMILLPIVTDTAWYIIDKSKKKPTAKPATSYVPAKGSKPITGSKHLLKEESPDILPAKKKQMILPANIFDLTSPPGLEWDKTNYSCAYDAFFGILYNIWAQDPIKWSEEFNYINEEYIGVLSDGFKLVLQGDVSLEDVRDCLRIQLHELNSEMFPMGENGASVGDLAFAMLASDKTLAESQRLCSECDYTTQEVECNLRYILHAKHSTSGSTLKWISELENSTKKKCPDCSGKMTKQIYYTEIPKLMVFEYSSSDIKTSHEIKFKTDEETIILHLRGIIYHGENHFTSRIISSEGHIWYHDGITTGSTCNSDGHLKTTTDNLLRHCQKKQLVMAIYAQN